MSLYNIYNSRLFVSAGVDNPIALHVLGDQSISGNIGIGITTPRQYLDVSGGNIILQGGFGINKIEPTEALDISGNAVIYGKVGIGTSISNNIEFDVYGDGIISGSVGIGTTIPRYALDIIGDEIISGSVGIGTTVPRYALDIVGNAIITGFVGIGTDDPQHRIDIKSGNIVINNGGIGIGTTTPNGRGIYVNGRNIILQDGNVGIGSTNPGGRLDVTGRAVFGVGDVIVSSTLPVLRYLQLVGGIDASSEENKSFDISPKIGTDAEGNDYIILDGDITSAIDITINSVPIKDVTTFPLESWIFYIKFNRISNIETTNTVADNVFLNFVNIIQIKEDSGGKLIKIESLGQTILNEEDILGDTNAHELIISYDNTNKDDPTKGTLYLFIDNVLKNTITVDPDSFNYNELMTPNLVLGRHLGTVYEGPYEGALHIYNIDFHVGYSVTIERYAPTRQYPSILDISGSAIVTGFVGINTATARQALDIVGDMIITGNIGVGTTVPEGLSVYKDAYIGSGLYGTGPFYKQAPFDTPSTEHIILNSDYCVSGYSSGTIYIQVSNGSTKMGTATVSFLINDINDTILDLFIVSNHFINITNFTITPSGSNILVTTDIDCMICWTSVGASMLNLPPAII